MIHVGLPKAASSFLQDAVFAASAAIYTPTPEVIDAVDLSNLFEAPDGAISNKDSAKRYELLRIAIDKQEQPAVLSDETLSMGSWLPGMETADRETICKRLHDAFPQARILIVLRPQDEWLSSWWRQYVNNMGERSIATILNSEFWRNNLRPNLFYTPLVEAYLDCFGIGNVTVIFVDELRRDSDAVVARIYELLGAPVAPLAEAGGNLGRCNLLVRARQLSNRVFNGLIRSERIRRRLVPAYAAFWKHYINRTDILLRRISGKNALSGAQTRALREVYKDDVAALGKLLGVDPADYGFRLE